VVLKGGRGFVTGNENEDKRKGHGYQNVQCSRKKLNIFLIIYSFCIKLSFTFGIAAVGLLPPKMK
jgi:hypothetical protein